MADETPKTKEEAPRVHVVRADDGRYAHAFRRGNYVAIGWMKEDLAPIIAEDDKEQLRELYERYEPDASKMRLAVNVGQIWRFLTEVVPGTYVVTPSEDNSRLMVGRVTGDYYFATVDDGCPHAHRRPVEWFDKMLLRNALSVPAQHTLTAWLAVYRVKQYEEILKPFGVSLPRQAHKTVVTEEAIRQLVIDQLLELSADEFEILVTDLLQAIGFEAQHVGRSGDGGVDVEGTLRVYDFATLDLKVQVKRYNTGKVSKKAVRDFRASIPAKSHAAFVTTSDFHENARLEAEKPDFKKIGLINGSQFVDILIEHYDDLSSELQEQLDLQRTLIPKA